MANFNAGAQGNPLDALLGGGSIYGSMGRSLSQAVADAYAGDPSAQQWLISQGYGRVNTTGESNNFEITDPNLDPQGYILRNGKHYSQLRSTDIGGPGQAIDPSKVIKDPQYGLITPLENLKPQSNGYGDTVFALAALGLGLPTAAAALGADAGAASTAGMASTDAAESGGTLALNTAGTGVVPYEGAAGATGALGTAGANTADGLDLSHIPYTPDGQITPLVNGPYDGLLGNLGQTTSGLLGQVGQYISDNPIRALGLAQTAYGLLGGGRGSSAAASSGGGSQKGGTGQGLSPGSVQQQFYVNPYTLAQLQRSRGGM